MASLLFTLLLVLHVPARASCSTLETVCQTVSSVTRSLIQEARVYLGYVIGQQRVDSVLTPIDSAVTVMFEATAHGLNGFVGLLNDLLGTAGLGPLSAEPVTSELLLFVAQCALLALVGYRVLLLVLFLLGVVLKIIWFLVKLNFRGLTFFWFILKLPFYIVKFVRSILKKIRMLRNLGRSPFKSLKKKN